MMTPGDLAGAFMAHRLLVPLLAASLLAACAAEVRPVPVKVSVKVSVGGDYSSQPRGAKFCPPGQAKKGRC